MPQGESPPPLGGREYLAEAIKIFAPYWAAGDEAWACEVLHECARTFLRHQQAALASPRRRQVKEDLDRVAALAGELAGLLEDLDPTGREALRQVWGPEVRIERRPGGTIEEREGDRLVPKRYPDGSPVRVFEPADLAGPRDRLYAWEGAPLWRRLRIAADLARRAGHRVPDDQGGRTNTFTERHGTAKGQLCRELGELLLQRAEKLGEAPRLSGGTAGPLYRATAAIYAYATGSDPEEAALERPVKDTARLLTRREELLANAREDGFALTDDTHDELRAIAEQLAAL